MLTRFQIVSIISICGLLAFSATEPEDEVDDVNKIGWRPVLEFNITTAMPAGMYNTLDNGRGSYYIITTDHCNDRLFGTFTQRDRKCKVDYYGTNMTVERERCKFLSYPMGSMSWLNVTTQTLPPTRSLVKAGKKGKMWLYICRTWTHYYGLMPGTLTYKEKKCQTGAKELNEERFEVLSINMLGMQQFKKARGIDHFFG